MVTSSAGVEMRLKPRTACTRSSSPGPASTTRASSTTPPSQMAIAIGVGDTGEDADDGQVAAGAAEAERGHGGDGEDERRQLRLLIEAPFRADDHPAAAGSEHDARRARRCPRPSR